MFVLIPIGSEEGVRRLPLITIGLIAINTIIYFITSMTVSAQAEALEKLHERLIQIEVNYTYRIMEVDPDMLDETDFMVFHERFDQQGIIPEYSEDYDRWHALFNELKEKQKGFVFHQWGFIPKEMDILKTLSSMFIHGDFFHLLFNMLFLWLVGCNIEDDWSWKVFIPLYVVSGVVACLLHAAMYPDSTSPLIGASGAIAGIMGAFMIRHYKTKVRFAYFFWFFRVVFGTFSIYAGIALPLWFIQEMACAAGWSAPDGTAHWAHVGGFAFGAVIGLSLKFFGLEKKYIAPMVEDSFEKLKTSPRMREINKMLNTGDAVAAIPLLLGVIDEEPENYDAPLMLARIYHEKGNLDSAVVMYNQALAAMNRAQDCDVVLSTLEEMREKNLISEISEKNLYNCAVMLETGERHREAAELFGIYVRQFPEGRVRAKALHRLHRLFKEKLDEPVLAEQSRAFLKKEHPDFPIQE